MNKRGVPFCVKENISYAEGSVVSKTILDKGVGNITLFAFDKGQGLSEHTSPFDAVVYILDGSAEILIGGASKDVKVGEMIIMPANVPHELKAIAPFKMMLIMIRGTGDRESGPIAV